MNKLRKYASHTILAFGAISVGLWLILNDRFFLWPPKYTWLANDDSVGAAFVFMGICICWWVLDAAHSPKSNSLLLAVASGMFAFLTAYEFMIWAATGDYQSWISNAIITAFVVNLARRSDTRHA